MEFQDKIQLGSLYGKFGQKEHKQMSTETPIPAPVTEHELVLTFKSGKTLNVMVKNARSTWSAFDIAMSELWNKHSLEMDTLGDLAAIHLSTTKTMLSL